MRENSVRTVIVGNRELAKYVLRHAIRTGWEVVGAVAPEDDLAARQANYTSLADVTQAADIPLVRTADINDEVTVRRLRELNPDICICPAWSQIIDPVVLDIPTRMFVGFHSSKLPRGRGGAPVNWNLIDGADRIWLSLFEYVPEVDAGDVLAQQSIPVEQRDDVDTVFDKIAVCACDILDEIVEPLASGELEPTAQSLDKATYRPRRQPQDGLINWNRPPKTQYDWVRALTKPYPGAYTFFDSHRLTVWGGEPTEDNAPGAASGEVIAVEDEGGLAVKSGEGVVRLTRLQIDDGPSMWADTLADRYGITAGTVFDRTEAPSEWLYTGIRDADGGTAYETNLDVGETGILRALIDTPNREREITVTAQFGRKTIEEKTVRAEGRTTVEIEYTASQRGSTTLTVEFFDENDCIDVRYLHVFSA